MPSHAAEPAIPSPAAEPARTATHLARDVVHGPPALAPSVPAHEGRRRSLLFASAGVALLAAAGAVVAVGAFGGGGVDAAPAQATSGVLGVETSSVQRTTTEEAPVAGTAFPRAGRNTPLRARAAALLEVPYPRLSELVGARVAANEVRVGAVVGDDVFWIGRGSERILVHLQGDGTLYAVRRGQRLTFSGVLSATRPGAAAAWGVTRAEGRRQLERQGHHIEVYGPDMRFDCVRACGGR